MPNPTLDEFLAKARDTNPGVSDGQLADYWLKNYGGSGKAAEESGTTAGGLIRSLGASAIDTLGSAAQGGGEVLAAGLRKVTGDQDWRAANPLRWASDLVKDGMSEGDKRATQDSIRGDILDPSNIELPKTAGGWAHAIASGFGSLSTFIIPATMALRGTRGAIAAGSLIGAATTGGAAADEVRQNVAQALGTAPHEQLMETVPAYRDAIRSGLKPDEAKQKVENDAALLATGLAGAMGAAGGAFNAKVLEDVVAKRGLVKVLGGAAKTTAGRAAVGSGVGVAAEGLQEGLEKVGQNIGENIGMGRPAGENVTRDTAGDVIMGGIIGGVTGGGAGIISRSQPAEKPDTSAADADLARRRAAMTDIATAPTVDTALEAFQRATATPALAPLEFDRLGALGALNAEPPPAAPADTGETIPFDYFTGNRVAPALPAPETPTGRNVLINDTDAELTRLERMGDRETAINTEQAAREQAAQDEELGITPGTRRAIRARVTLDEGGNVIEAEDGDRRYLATVRRDARPHAAAAINAHAINPQLTEAALAAPNVGPQAEQAIFEAIINGRTNTPETQSLLARYGLRADGNGQGAQPVAAAAPGQRPDVAAGAGADADTGGDNRGAGVVRPPQVATTDLQRVTPDMGPFRLRSQWPHDMKAGMLGLIAKNSKSFIERAIAKAELDRRNPTRQADRKAHDARKALWRTIVDSGGVSEKEAADIGIDPKALPGYRLSGLISPTGMRADILARTLAEAGYLTPQQMEDVDGGAEAARQVIADLVAREFVGRQEELAEIRTLFEGARPEVVEAVEALPSVDREDVADYDDSAVPAAAEEFSVALDAEPNMTTAEAMRALGFTEEEIADAERVIPQERETVAREAGQDEPGGPENGGEGDARQAERGGREQDGEGGDRESEAAVVDAAAHEAATSPKNDLPQPTDAQKEAGNYKKGHVTLSGLDVAIENPAGSKRRPEWPALKSHYGYVKRTEGADGDHVDVFIKPGTPLDYDGPVFVVDQRTKDGGFDEHKVMIGWPDEAAARAGYLENYTKGWDGIQGIAPMTMDGFKAWLRDGDTTKPVAKVSRQDPSDVLTRLGFNENGPGPDEWVRPVSKLGDVIAKPVGDDRFEVSAEYMGKRFATETVSGEAELQAKADEFAAKINEGREKLAREVAAKERGLPDAKAKTRAKLDAQKTSPDQRATAQRLADDVGGTVAWQEGDLALIRGYSVLTGQPVYSVAIGPNRSRVDVEAFTGDQLKPEDKARLVRIKADLEAADAERHASAPFIKFNAEGLAFSSGVDARLAGVLAGWKSLLGLRANIYVTTLEDARADRDKFTGPHRAIGSAGLDANEAGSMRRMGDGYYIAFRKGTSVSKMLETLAHELGHVHEREAFANADPETQKAIRAAHDRFVNEYGQKTGREFVQALRARVTGRAVRADDRMASELSSYWKSFSEWYADQVAKWAVSAEKPVGVVERFFARLANALKRFYQTLKGQAYLPDETMRQYLDRLAGPVVDEKAVARAAKGGKIEDVGEKIGGARKDTAKPVGTRRTGSTEAEGADATWAKRFQIAEVVSSSTPGEVGKWSVTDLKNKDFMGNGRQIGVFDSKQAAEAMVPIYAVALKHAVQPASVAKGEPQAWEIIRKVGDRKRVKVVEQNFATREDALRYVAEHAVQILETKTSFGEEILPRPDNVTRTGAERRKGNVSGDDFKDTFGFRGVEFGNWNAQDERQTVMNHAYDALMDLADVLGIPPKAISLNGELALAFGARGHGLTGARAHYERDYGVINLTKMQGAGTLAHEWFHALDHYFGRQDTKASSERMKNERGDTVLKASSLVSGDMVSHGFSRQSKVRPEVRAAYDAVIQTMFKKAETYVEDTAKADRFVGETREDLRQRLDALRQDLAEQKDVRYWKRNNKPATAEQLAEVDRIAAALLAGEFLQTDWRLVENKTRRNLASGRWTNDTLEQLSAIYKAVRGRSGFDSQGNDGFLDRIRYAMERYSQRLKMLADAQSGAEKSRQVPTEFAMEAKSIDQGRASDYWTTPHEMAARAFQAYVEDRIAAQNARSDFLSYGTNMVVLTPWGWRKPYPRGAEREAINKAFDQLFQTIETREGDSGNVIMASRPGYPPPYKAMAANRFAEKSDANGMPVFASQTMGLAQAREQEALGLKPGEKAMAFDIFDRRMKRPNGAATKVGEALVYMRDGKFTSLRNIKIREEYREQGFYHGEGVIAAMLQHNGGTSMEVYNIQSAARGDEDDALPFWRKIGATLTNISSDPDIPIEGRISQSDYLKAGEKRSKVDDYGTDSSRNSGGESPAARRDGALGGQSDTGGGSRERSGGARTRNPVSAVRAELARALGEDSIAALEDEGILHISTWAGAPAALTDALRDGDHAAYWPGRGAWLFADNIKPGQAVSLLLHEIGEHYGLEAMLGKKGYDRLIAQVKTLHKMGNPAIVKAWNHVERHYDAEPGSRIFMHEVIAKAGQDARVTGMKWWQKMLEDIRAFLIRVGLKRVAGQRDLEVLLSASLRKVMAGAKARGVTAGEVMAERDARRITDTPAFRRWFGDSKVVDAQGNPLVVYHGTQRAAEGIDRFDAGATYWGAKAAKESVHWFTSSAGLASNYANWISNPDPAIVNGNPTVYPVYVALKNPARLEDLYAVTKKDPQEAPYDARVIRALKKKGFDGIMWTANEYTGGMVGQDNPGQLADTEINDVTVIAFYPEQIKSAIGNSGAFDPSNPSILASRGPLRDTETAKTVAGVWDTVTSAGTAKGARDAFLSLMENPNRFNLWDKTIGTQLNKAKKNRYFRAVFDALQRQADDTAAFAIEAEAEAVDVLARMADAKEIKSALKATLSGQRGEDLRAVSKAIFANIEGKEGVKQKVFSDEELKRDFGLNERQIGMYRQSRAAIDRSLDRYAQSLAVKMAQKFVGTDDLSRMGLDETVDELAMRLQMRADTLAALRGKPDNDIAYSLTTGPDGVQRQSALAQLDPGKALEKEIEAIRAVMKKLPEIQTQAQSLKDKGYAPAMRFGNYSVTAWRTDPRTGEREAVFFSMVESKTAANLLKMRLAKEMPGREIVAAPVDKASYKLFRGLSPDTVDLFARFMEVEADAAFKEYVALATSSRSALKHMLERKGVAGFSENLPRVLSAFITSNARAAALNLNGYGINEAFEQIPQAQGDVKAEAAELINYMRNPTDDGAKIRGFMFAYFMGGSVSSALVNLTQPVLMTAPYLSQFAGTRVAKIMTAAGRQAATGKGMSTDVAAALTRAEAEGITDAHEYFALMQEAEGGGSVAGRAFMKTWGAFFSQAEKFNRKVTFLAALEVAKGMTAEQLRATNSADAYDFAKQAVEETQGVYARHNRPNWARGTVGALLMTFKQFSIAWVEFFVRLPRKQQLLALGLLMLAAGLEGLPFAEDLEDLIDTVGQKMGYGTNSKKALRKTLTSVLGDTGAQFALHGISGVSGVPMDVSGRLGMGNLIPGTKLLNPSVKEKASDVLEIAGPAGGAAKKMLEAGDKLNPLAAAPKAIADAAKAVEMFSTGEYRDSRGRKVDDVDALDAFMKAIGFQPQTIAAQSRAINEDQRDVDIVKRVASEIADEWAEGIRTGDREMTKRARDRIREWNADNPDLPVQVKLSNVLKRVKQANLTRDERFMKTAPPALRRRLLAETVE